jgi:hypothetical protein
MKMQRYLIAVSAVLALPMLINLFGRNIFLYLGSGDRKLVIAASQGVCHIATTTEDHDVESYSGFISPDDLGVSYAKILKIGPIDLFSETRMDPMYWFRFDHSPRSGDYDYSAIEFPWLLFPLVPLAILPALRIRTKKI